ncbi:protein scalloped-like [Panonychus citri]|uniref:protein scalloped-like n=1 Tax=Panonychus citri TaxID=50023 RepID=UPI002307A0CD|nr:protein scalloped-like [Panonychus citri]
MNPTMSSHDDDSSKDGSLEGDIHNTSNSDAEGVWSADIEQSFQEALAIYPPCGRRKIILSDEGKMYGRNELIARYIKLRTGKTRTRKQVSSHIQVLARRKAREMQSKLKTQLWQPAGPTTTDDIKPFNELKNFNSVSNLISNAISHYNNHNNNVPSLEDRCIATHELRLCEFTAFLEIGSGVQATKHIFVQIGGPTSFSDPILEDIDIRQISDKFPQNKEGLKELYDKGPQNAFFLVKFWADLGIPQDLMLENAFYGVTAMFESSKSMMITCSTKVCSFGKQVVEKVEVEYPNYENGRNVYRFEKSPMCEYMINFIHKLKDLPEKYMMNSVLENFTILQVITNRETQDTLLCIAFVFEVSASEHGAQHHIYRLTNNDN